MISHATRSHVDPHGLAALDAADTQVLGTREERDLLNALGECKTKLADALKTLPGTGVGAESLAHYIARLRDGDGVNVARLGAIARRYEELRSTLVLANMRLVAHVAKRFRDRGIAYSDLLQEGVCGLLEAIDRFDLGRETKLATYATWWIRQSIQRAVAGGAYPVRLSARHLRQLAQSQSGADRGSDAPQSASTETIRRIHAATRPTVSLNAGRDVSGFSLVQTLSEPDSEGGEDLELDEAIVKLMGTLQPREQAVLELRYGLSGKERLSLSQVGKVMSVSKERVRQIQDRALTKLRVTAAEESLESVLLSR